MTVIRLTVTLMLSMLVFVPWAEAGTASWVCGGFHSVRPGPPAELFSSSIGFRNLSPTHSATVERITIRNFFGDVVHDSGPAIGVAHPLNTTIAPAHDITVVPPGASYWLATDHIWGLDSIPGPSGQGTSMTIKVKISTPGNADQVLVGRTFRVRERLSTETGFTTGIEHSRDSAGCTRLF